jgi:hypothetical protein
MTLITRQGKGSKLTIQEMDNNLTYLENIATQQDIIGRLSQGGIIVSSWVISGVTHGLVMSVEDISSSTFGWNDLSDVSTRTYVSFRASNANRIGENILNQDFVMRETTTNRYWKIKFTKWTQGWGNGGFIYIRTEINTSGEEISSPVTFEKSDNGNEVDIIIQDVLHITRDDNGPIYNTIFGKTDSNVDPVNTVWNSKLGVSLYQWSNIDDESAGQNSRSFFDGKSNTNTIIIQDGHEFSAAKVAIEYNGGGFDDWFLPSLSQLKTIPFNSYKINKILVEYGYDELSNFKYWTSTERSNDDAYYVEMITGYSDYDNKYDRYLIRAFREF